MIITRTPFRVSLCGGGSDMPSFYEKHGGCVVSTAIDKYMYISVHPSFDRDTTVLKYSQTECVHDYNEIQHRYFRQMLKDLNVSGIEITSTADVPAGTGLGSSSAFTVGVLHALNSYKGRFVGKEQLARDACDTEIYKLKQPVGKQDQYAASYGGLNFYTFNPNGSVFVDPIIISDYAYEQLQNNLLLFYTGNVRLASGILKEQRKNIMSGAKEQNLIKMCEMAKNLRDELQCNYIDGVGKILHDSWVLKKTLACGISNAIIDEYYDAAIRNGAIGGKLLGAGGGGFLLFYVKANQQQAVRNALPLQEMRFRFDGQGSTVIYVGQKTEG